jgi:hypothetical protein
MRYVIRKFVLGRVPEIEISADDYSALAVACSWNGTTYAQHSRKRNPELKNLARRYATGKAGIAEKQNAGQP